MTSSVEVRLYFRIWRALISLLLAPVFLFVALCIDVMADGPFWSHPTTLLLVPPPAVFGCFLLVSGVGHLVYRLPVIEMGPAGITSRLWLTTPLAWSEIESVALIRIGRRFRPSLPVLGIRLMRHSRRGIGRYVPAPAWRDAFRCDVYLPLGRLGFDPDRLVETIDRLAPGLFEPDNARERRAYGFGFGKTVGLAFFAAPIVAVLVSIAALAWVMAPEPEPDIAIVSAGLFLVGIGLALMVVWRFAASRPVVVLGPEGLLFTPYMRNPLPWTEIAKIERDVRTSRHGRYVYIGLLLKDPSAHPHLTRRPLPGILSHIKGRFDAVLCVNLVRDNGPGGLFDALTRFLKRYGAQPVDPHSNGTTGASSTLRESSAAQRQSENVA